MYTPPNRVSDTVAEEAVIICERTDRGVHNYSRDVAAGAVSDFTQPLHGIICLKVVRLVSASASVTQS